MAFTWPDSASSSASPHTCLQTPLVPTTYAPTPSPPFCARRSHLLPPIWPTPQADTKLVVMRCGPVLLAVDQHAADERVQLEALQRQLQAQLQTLHQQQHQQQHRQQQWTAAQQQQQQQLRVSAAGGESQKGAEGSAAAARTGGGGERLLLHTLLQPPMQLNLTLQVRWGVCGGGGEWGGACAFAAQAATLQLNPASEGTQPAQEGGLLFHGLAEPVD